MKELEKVKNQLHKNNEYSGKYDKVISEESLNLLIKEINSGML